MIRVRDISASYGLRSASFELDSGLIALVGPNGSGKTTLIKVLAGLLPVKGELEVDKLIAYLPQTLEFLDTMRVEDVVGLGRAPYRGQLGKLSISDRHAVSRAMAATDTDQFADRPLGELSGGERARVGLARALATEAPILLADEPTASLDVGVALDMMERLSALPGLVVCAVHDLALAARFADRVLVMHEGCLVADGGPDILSGPVAGEVFGISPPSGGWQIPRSLAKRAR